MIRKIFIGAAALVAFTAAPAAAQYAHATIRVSPHSVLPLEQHNVSGNGFVAGEAITLTAGAACGSASSGATGIGTATAGAGGSFSVSIANGFPFGTRPGIYGIRAHGASGDFTCGNVVVRRLRAVIFVRNHTVVPGHSFGVAGTRFVPHETVTFTIGQRCSLGSGAGATTIGTTTVDNHGSFSTMAQAIPVGTKPNTYGIRGTGSHGDFTCTDVFVTGNTQPHPTMHINPSTIIPSDHLKVSGAGFNANETFTITIGRPCGAGPAPGDVVLGTGMTGADGSVSDASHTVPAGTRVGATYGVRTISTTGAHSCANVFLRQRHHPHTTPPLLRVNPTTTGVTSAIVACGGMVLLRTRRRRPAQHKA